MLEYLKVADTMFILSPLLVPQMPTLLTSLLLAAIMMLVGYQQIISVQILVSEVSVKSGISPSLFIIFPT